MKILIDNHIWTKQSIESPSLNPETLLTFDFGAYQIDIRVSDANNGRIRIEKTQNAPMKLSVTPLTPDAIEIS